MRNTPTILVRVILAGILFSIASPALSDEYRSFCKKISEEYTAITVDSGKGLKNNELRELRNQLLVEHSSFSGLLNRMAARSKYLIGRGLSKSEARANLFSLCLSLR